MSKNTAIQLGKIKSNFTKLPLPIHFSRIISVLLSYLDKNTYLAWPSKARLAACVGCSEKTVQRHLKIAIKLGLFKVRRLGRQEMEAAIGKELPGRNQNQRYYCLYKLNPGHLLWENKQVDRVIQIIKEDARDGIDRRLRGGEKPKSAHITGKTSQQSSSSILEEDPFAGM